MWRLLFRPMLFRMDPEWVHHCSMNLFAASVNPRFAKALVSRLTRTDDPRLEVNKFGISFKNPVGLAAGFDKDALWFEALSTLGFSHIEVGTLTGQPQPGNPKKRLFRLPLDEAILNCMGFNNRGSEEAEKSLLAARKKATAKRAVLGINIGLTKKIADQIHGTDTIQSAIDDYLLSFRRMSPFADYITINVSSPNTPGLRDLQHPKKLGELIAAIKSEITNDGISQTGEDQSETPIFVKLAPDLSQKELEETLDAVTEQEISGIIATNTTISAEGLLTDRHQLGSMRCQCPTPGGGISGRPLTKRSRDFVASIFRRTKGQLPIIGVGGIMNGADAWNMIAAGASLIQVYSGFIYGGPFFVKSSVDELSRRLDKANVSSINDIVGQDV